MIPDALLNFLGRGGPTLWIIAGLSVLTLALILWKIWRLALLGAWSGSATALLPPASPLSMIDCNQETAWLMDMPASTCAFNQRMTATSRSE